MNPIVWIEIEFEDGCAKVLDDRGRSGDIIFQWTAGGQVAAMVFNAIDLKRGGKNIKPPRYFNKKSGKPYCPVPKEVWTAMRKAHEIIVSQEE